MSARSFGVKNAAPYSLSDSIICELGVTETAVGPDVTLLLASIVNWLPDVKVSSAETSILTVRDAPGPLLSVGALIA